MSSGEAAVTGIEVLDRESCTALLRTADVGRLAWAAADGRVQVRPVTFGLDGESVTIRCGPGSMLTAIREGRPVTFEVDRLEPALQSGWSVLIVGAVAELVPGDEGAAGSVEPWARGGRPYLVRLRAGEVSGRRLPLLPGEVSVVRMDP